MDTQKKARRNVIIFSVITLVVGWLMLAINDELNAQSPPDAQGSLGMLIWLVIPILTMLGLRLFAGDGWKDIGIKPNFKGNGWWYLVSLLVYPAFITVVLLLGGLTGATTFPGFANGDIGTFIGAVIGAFVFNFVKNLFEEFAWRGYLTPKLMAAGYKPLTTHLITGAVWAGWHVPYWLGLLDRADFNAATGLSLPVYVILGAVAIVIAAIAYGEIRLATDSVIPVVLMHTIGNAIILTLTLENYVAFKGAWEAVFSPGMESLLMITGFAVLGWWLFNKRKAAAEA